MHPLHYCLKSVVRFVLGIVISAIFCSYPADGQCPNAVFSCPVVNGTTDSTMIQFAVFSNIHASIESFRALSNTDVYIWKFGTQTIMSLFYFNSAWTPTIDALYMSRVMKHSENPVSSGTRFNITIGNIQQSETMLLLENNRGDTSSSFSLKILECNTTMFAGATTSGSGVCGYGCNRTFSCNDPSYVDETLPVKFCLANATWSDDSGCTLKTTTAEPATSNGIVTTDSGSTQGNNIGTTSGNDSSSARSTISSSTDEGGEISSGQSLEGWEIFLIVFGSLIGVFLILFISWWFCASFRDCLHNNISSCFPEDRCCGKEYSKGSSS